MATADSPLPPGDAARCSAPEEARRGCASLPTYAMHEGRPYCVLHLPHTDKQDAFRRAVAEKLERRDSNFISVWFPSDQSFYKVEFGRADFSLATFNGPARFTSSTFGAVEFGGTVFRHDADFGWEVEFRSHAIFVDTIFEGEANFSYARFREGYFRGGRFARAAKFFHATFEEMAAFSAAFDGEVDFSLATFAGRASFRESTFEGPVRFFATSERRIFLPGVIVSFAGARFAMPELVSFQNLTLQPHWFINTDARQIELTNVEWQGTLGTEIEGARAALAQAPHRVVEQACNRLAVNAESNQRYEEASRFRYWAMDARRRERARGLACWRLDWWYWAASGYGERAPRALAILVAVWLLFAGLYTQVDFRGGPPAATVAPPPVIRLDMGDALVHSFGVMTLQRPEPAPASRAGRALVMMEAVAAPIQAALLALAVRRKFMR